MAFFNKKRLRRIRAEPVDHLAHKLEHQGFHDADADRKHGQHGNPFAHAFNVAPNKPPQPFFRRFRGGFGVRVDSGFEP